MLDINKTIEVLKDSNVEMSDKYLEIIKPIIPSFWAMWFFGFLIALFIGIVVDRTNGKRLLISSKTYWIWILGVFGFSALFIFIVQYTSLPSIFDGWWDKIFG